MSPLHPVLNVCDHLLPNNQRQTGCVGDLQTCPPPSLDPRLLLRLLMLVVCGSIDWRANEPFVEGLFIFAFWTSCSTPVPRPRRFSAHVTQVSDGAAASLLMTRKRAAELGLRPLGVFRSYAVVGVPPEIMGIGPAVAIPAAVTKAGLGLKDVDVFELNEAFASQATYCIKVRKRLCVADVYAVDVSLTLCW